MLHPAILTRCCPQVPATFPPRGKPPKQRNTRELEGESNSPLTITTFPSTNTKDPINTTHHQPLLNLQHAFHLAPPLHPLPR